MIKKKQGEIIIPEGTHVWLHELRVAEILASAGYVVEFIKEGLLPEADILLDGVKFEIKSPEKFNANTLEHTIKDALKQSSNIIIDMFRMKKVSSVKVRSFLVRQVRTRKQVKKMILITRQGEVIDIFSFL